MPISSPSFKEDFYSLILEFLWNQWSSLGIAGHQFHDDNRIIDPEALLLVTTSFSRRDPRLFDEVVDWLVAQGDIINLQRLKNLQSNYSLGNPKVLAVIAGIIGARPANAKWRSLQDQEQPLHKPGSEDTLPSTAEPLFHDVPVVGEPDNLFRSFGWLRDPIRLRGLSTFPDPHRPTNLLIKLRSLFGLQTRAEILACLLGSENSHPAQIAKATGYFPRTVQISLNEMARSGHLFFHKEAREKHFYLEKEDWRFLIKKSAGKFPQWIAWGPIFALLEAISLNVNTASSPTIQAMEIRNVLEETSLDSALRRKVQPPPNLKGDEMLAAFMENLKRLLIEGW